MIPLASAMRLHSFRFCNAMNRSCFFSSSFISPSVVSIGPASHLFCCRHMLAGAIHKSLSNVQVMLFSLMDRGGRSCSCRADGFVVKTGDPEGPSEGFVDPSTGKVRTIPLEVMGAGDRSPIYGATLEELGRYKDRMKLPFNAFGTMAMARDEFQEDSASSQIFWLLKESEVTPSRSNILDGRYAVFGYVTENQDYLADLKVGDVIESVRVVSGIDNLVNPSYKIVG